MIRYFLIVFLIDIGEFLNQDMKRFVIIVLAVVVYSIPIPEDVTSNLPKSTTELSSLIDRILDLALIRVREKTPDPVNMHDEVKQYKKKIFLVEIDGEITMYNGMLWGLNTIRRFGDPTFYKENGSIYVVTQLQFDTISVLYDFEANIMKLTPSGKINGTIMNLIIEAVIKIQPLERKLTIERSKLVKARKLTIYVESKRIFDTLANYILRIVTSLFKTTLLHQLDKEIKHYIGSGIEIKV